METARTKSINPIDNKVITNNEAIVVSTDIKVIEPTTEEMQYLEEEYVNWKERDDYNHLAYSRY